jgi:phenylpropionate dioxygenase-like ring-hydroxylating dioxygenase large terminal subunit
MFISKTHLPQVLAPEHYTSREQFDREMSLLFLPGWHCIGALDDIPNDGDYFTFNLLGHPLIVWRMNGDVHTFLNVCAHRFSTLRDTPCGHMDTLHCQYHGWEYDETGNTRKIPDSKSFKPMTQGMLGLRKYRTELLGQAIYVNLSDEAPSLAEAIGPGYEIGQKLFSLDRRLFMSLNYEVEANWKVKVENTLESYHVELIHAKTFGRTPDEEICHHELEPGWTTFTTTEEARTSIDRWLIQFINRIAETDVEYEYKHYLYYPSVMFMRTGLITVAETTLPLAPNRTQILVKVFVYTGPNPDRLKSRLLYRGIRRWGKPFFSKIAAEDAGIMPSIHKGMEAPERPSEGLISIREERLFHFQEYIRKATIAEINVSEQTPEFVPQ